MKTIYTIILLTCASLINNTAAQSYIIPVVFHVLHQGGSENIADSQIVDAIRILNEDYNKENADTSLVIPYYQNNIADMQVEFRLATIDPNGNPTNGIDRISSPLTNDGTDSAKINQWNPYHYLNIWSVKSINLGVAGYAYYPWVADSIPTVDGVMLLNNYIGSVGTSDTNHRRALTHEIGHYLCLLHTFWQDSCLDNDSVPDTPPSQNQFDTMSCITGVPSNLNNFMGYYYKSAMFTNGQKTRVHNCLESSVAHRDSLWSPNNLVATGVINGIQLLNLQARLVKVYPNPASSCFSISLSSPPYERTEFQLFDLLGRQIITEEISVQITTIQRNNLPSGIYTWRLLTGNKTEAKGKIVFE